MSCHKLHFSSILVLLFLTVNLMAEEVTFPLQAKIIDVTIDPYNAKGDGKTDDTEAIQKALDDHPNGNYLIYLPKGVYLVSRTLTWPKGADTAQAYRRTILQGQDIQKTIIRLAPKSVGFDNPEIPKAVIYTGLGPAPRFRNAIRDLSLQVGKGNPGAVGIRFNAAMQGTINNVKIIAEDRKGVAGIDMSFAPFIGPLLVNHVEVVGFDVGILTGSPYNGMTLEHIVLSDQKKAGLLNQGQMVTIRALSVRGNVPGIHNLGPTATLTLTDAKFDHTREGERGPAIINQGGVLFVRNTVVSGYSKSIVDDQGPGDKELDVYEYSSHGALQLCSSPKLSLRLPIAETPSVSWGNTGNWVAISGDYGGSVGDGSDDSKAIQQAIDDGAETIYFNPGGRYTITRDVIIRKQVRRIIGIEAKIDGTGKFIIADGVAPKISIERFESFGAGIKHLSNRTLILRNMGIGSYESREIGSGDVFFEDVSASGSLSFNLQKVWARQLHLTYDQGTQIANHGGTVWILGLTTTRGNKIIHTHMAGETEVLGAHVIAGPGAKNQPMFTSDTSSISIAGLRESAPAGNEYPILIEEERPDQSLGLKKEVIPVNASGARTIPLFVGYVPKTGLNLPPKVNAGKDQLLVLPRSAPLAGFADDDGRGTGLCAIPVTWNKVGGAGRVSFSRQKDLNSLVSFSYSGIYDLELSATDGKLTRTDTSKVVAWDRKITTRDHNGDNIPSGRGADAVIAEEYPDSCLGKSPELPVQFSPGKSTKMLLRFDLSALPGPVSDAALQFKLKPRKDSLPVIWNVYGIREQKSYGAGKLGEMWAEDSVTWNNAPGSNSIGGGYYDEKLHAGGGAEAENAKYLGSLTLNSQWPFGYYFQSRALNNFLKEDPNRIISLLISSEAKYGAPDIAASKEHSKIEPPSLYVNFIDPNRSVGGDVVPGGYRMSPVDVDPYALQVSFSLLIANPQVVKVEVFNEQGRRVLLVYEQQMEGEKLTPFQFNAKDLETGVYTIKVQGEAFKGEEKFVLLN
jgi:hypothetical protein